MNPPPFEAPDLAHLAERLPAYDFEALIAVGGMGAVYKARQRSLDRDVAIKILPKELGEDPEFRESFIHEARAMARLNHPNLIGVYDSGDIEGMPFMVMEYVHGKSLYHSAVGSQVEARQAVELMRGVCEGLSHAHQSGIIHRDIKPANILLTPQAEPKIGDFGLARPAGPDSPGLIMGTPGYVAPEVMAQPDHADHRSDLFAVGVLLYELLTGTLPDSEPLPPSTLCGCDPRLDEICAKAMQPDPDLRYASAREMARDLDQWLKQPVATVPATPAGAGAARASGRENRGRTNWILMRNLVIIVVLLLLIRGVWNFTQAQKEAMAADAAAPVAADLPVLSVPPDEKDGTAAKAAANPPPPVELPPVELPEVEPERPMDGLERLREALVAGERVEFPRTTIGRDGHWFFPVGQPMTWYEAAHFAEQYGGVLSAATGLEFPEHPPARRWLGVARNSSGAWLRLDGGPWTPDSPVAGTGDFLTAAGDGALAASGGGERLEFVIEWSEQARSGDLARLLETTGRSLEAGAPVFPPGTVDRDGVPSLALPSEMDAAEAARLAELAGGTLAGGDAAGTAEEQVIEWDPAEIPGSPLAIARAEQRELQERAKVLVKGLVAELRAGLAENARTFTWDLDAWLRTLSKGEANSWRPEVEKLKALVQEGRVPEVVPKSVGLSPKMAAVAASCAKKQQSLDAEFEAKARRIHTAFLAKLSELATAGDLPPTVARTLAADRQAAEDFARWLEGLDVAASLRPSPPQLKILKAAYGTSGRTADVTERVRELVELGNEFRPTPAVLGADPNPGYRKELTVDYEVDGQPSQRRWGELTVVDPSDFTKP